MSITNGTTTPMKVNKNRTSRSSFGNNFLTKYQSIDTVTIAKNNATKRWARPQLDKQLANPRRTAVGFATVCRNPTRFGSSYFRPPTTKQASNSSTDQGGGKRRAALILTQIKVRTSRDFLLLNLSAALKCEATDEICPACAQRYRRNSLVQHTGQSSKHPWCAEYGGTPSGPTNCGFVTFQQCLDTISGIGGFCVRNNMYQPPPGPHPSKKGRPPY